MIAVSYTQTYHGYFWQWEDAAQVAALAVPGTSATIAWRAYIADALQLLAPQGIPPLGTLLAAIVATNPNGADNIEHMASGLLSLAKQSRDEEILADACNFLRILAALPQDVKAGNNRKLLFQSIFYKSHKLLSLTDSAKCVRYLAQTENAHIIAAPIYSAPNLLRVEFRPLALLAAKFKTLEDLLAHLVPINWLPPEPVEIPELPKVPNTPADLISQLTTNPKTQKIGSLVPLLWAGLQIPLHASQVGGMPLGGIADISNKGDLDRLLLSEYANDDWLLLSRLASNEALYWRREVPPAHHNNDRVILLDTSLRMWGTPRLLALAVAVSVTHHPRSSLVYDVFGVGSSFRQLPLTTVGHILGAMQEMDASLTASVGIDSWFAQNTPTNQEVVVITSTPNLRHPHFIQTVSKYPAITSIIAIDNSGVLDFYNVTKSGRSHRQQMALPLQKLWQQKEKNESHVNTIASAIPLRFVNASTDRKVLITAEGAIFQITRDKNLFYHPGFKNMHVTGWVLLATGIPTYNCHYAMGTLPTGHFLMLLFNRNDNTIQLRNLTTNHIHTVKFPHWQPTDYPSFIFVNDAFFHQNYSGSWQIHTTGQVIEVPAMQLSLFSDVDTKIKETEKKLPVRHTVLRNIHTIYINIAGNLVVNIHELIVKRNMHIKFEKTQNDQQVVVAPPNQAGLFTFPDGSTIENHVAGVLILRSSNSQIPTMYIPSVVGGSIGIATDNAFSGNLYYCHINAGTDKQMASVQQFFSSYVTPFIQHILLSCNAVNA